MKRTTIEELRLPSNFHSVEFLHSVADELENYEQQDRLKTKEICLLVMENRALQARLKELEDGRDTARVSVI